jgi:DNA-directed RNA polymerase specialized sigma24 family protein
LEFIVPEEAEAFRGDSDADLLGYMAMQDEDPEVAPAAYAEFYRRHVRWLYAALMRNPMQHLLGGPDAVPEFVQDTFQRAFAKAGTFDPEDATDRAVLETRCRAWLGVIGNNLIADALRAGVPSGFADLSHVELQVVAAPSYDPPSDRVAVMREIIDELSEREKDIVLEWAHHYKPGAAQQRLPNDASAALAKRWSMTTTHVRVIRKRMFDRIKREFPKRLTRRGIETKP